MSETAYSFSLTTFSPQGRLVQLDHAFAAVGKGALTLGVAAKDGVVIISERKIPSILVEDDTLTRIVQSSPSTGMLYSGIGPDFRVLYKDARKFTENYRLTYGEYPRTIQVVKHVASIMQDYTQSGGVRPFGCSLLISGRDVDGTPSLYQVDPSGVYYEWQATSLGRNSAAAKNYLEKRYIENCTLSDAIHTALLTMSQAFDGSMNEENIQVGVVGGEYGDNFQILKKDQIKALLKELEGE